MATTATRRKTTAKKATPSSRGKTLAERKVERVMHERKQGTLRSSSGQKVTSRKQAIAIGLSEAREAGARIPKQPGS